MWPSVQTRRAAFSASNQAIRTQAWTGPLGLQEVEAPRISSLSAHECLNVVSPMQRLPLLPRRFPWYSFLLETESNAGPYRDRKD
jgi:hypothetical protein